MVTTDTPISAKKVKRSEAREQLAEALAFVQGGRGRRVMIEDGGRTVAALISRADLEWFDMLIERWNKDFEVLHEISRAFDGIPDEEIEEEAIKAISEIRAEARAKRREGAILKQ